jgi:hypothetical protein
MDFRMERMMNRTWMLMLGLALVFSACAKKDMEDPKPQYPVNIETVDGIKTITNPAFPRDGVFKYDLIEEFSIGDDEESSEALLYLPIYLHIDSHDHLYVMDWGDTNIKVFDKAGDHVRTIGKKGQGPGEFQTPAYIRIGADDQLCLLDSRQNRISMLNLDGSYISGFVLEGFSSEFDVDAYKRIYIAKPEYPEVKVFNEYQLIKRSKTIYRVDENGENRFDLGSYRDASQRRKVVKTSSGMSTSSSTSREAYTTVWFISPNQRLYLGYSQDYMINVYDMGNNPLFKFGREFTALEHPHYTPESPHPEFYPAFYNRHYFFDDDGNLWLRQYTEEEDEELGIYDVFSPDGIYIKQVHLPHYLYKFKNGRAYTILRTEEDFRIVKCFKLVESNENIEQ